MKEIIFSFNPIFMIVALMLTGIAAFTFIDIFQHMKSTKGYRSFLFWGSCFSLSISIWMMDFFGTLAYRIGDSADRLIVVSALSLFCCFIFTSLSLLFFILKKSWTNLVAGAFVFTVAVIGTGMIHMFAIETEPSYNLGIVMFSFLFLFAFSICVFWFLFYSKAASLYPNGYKFMSAAIITVAIAQGFLLVLKSSIVTDPDRDLLTSYHLGGYWLLYGILFLTVLAFVGLLLSSVMENGKMRKRDLFTQDIMAALETSSIVAVTDPQGVFTYINDGFLRISQYRRDELIGRDFTLLSTGYHTTGAFQKVWKEICGGKVWEGEIRNRAKDGTYFWLHATITPFMDKKGQPHQFVAILNDITRRKEMEGKVKQSLREVHDYKYALDHASIVAITDADGVIRSVNDNFCRISKYAQEELIGKDHSILNSGHHPKEFFSQLWKTIKRGDVWKGEIKNKAKDGSFYWVQTTIVPFLDDSGTPYQYLAIRNDITERKKQEEMLHRQEKLSALGQLAAGVAHEIRNPLTSMKGYTEFLLLDEKEGSRVEHLEIILEEIDRVDSIVEEFMMLAKPQTDKMERRNIVAILKNTVSLFTYELKKRKVKLTWTAPDEEIIVCCDENRLRQVFLNLLKNGIEAMPEGGQLAIQITAGKDGAAITIRDTGCGIAEESLKRIGEPFYTTKESGTGLGLMISFRIIESHRGRLEIESESGKGTACSIYLPVIGAGECRSV